MTKLKILVQCGGSMNQQLVNMAIPASIRNKKMTVNESIKFLWNKNLIVIGELAEQAIVKKSTLKQHSRNTKGSDFNDNSDSKYVTVSHYQTKLGCIQSYASIGGIKNKIGALRVMVFEPKTEKNYFFLIPHRIYKPYIGKNDSLKIYFDKNGKPRRPTRADKRYDLWDYRCSANVWAGTK